MTQGLRQAWIARASQNIILDVLWYVQACASDSPNLQSTRYTILLRLPPLLPDSAHTVSGALTRLLHCVANARHAVDVCTHQDPRTNAWGSAALTDNTFTTVRQRARLLHKSTSSNR